MNFVPVIATVLIGNLQLSAAVNFAASRHGEIRSDDATFALASGQSEADATLMSLSARMLGKFGKRPHLNEVIHAVGDKVNLKSAARRLQAKHLPGDVMGLINTAANSSQEANETKKGDFAESSLTKAREVLNDMVQSSQAELDGKIIDCQTFKEANRGTFDQIATDLARLASSISNLERQKLEANNGITKTKEDIITVKEHIATERQAYLKQRSSDEGDMRTRQNDLSVFQFILEFTKCESEGALLLQQNSSTHSKRMNICEKHDELVIDFGNAAMQSKYQRMLTPSARKEIAKVLGQVRAARPLSLMQTGQDPSEEGGGTTTYQPIMSATVPVLEGPGEDAGMVKCPPTPPDCGLLHDKMSLLWGQFKDLVDELQADMDHREEEWNALYHELQKELEILTNSLNKFSSQLAEATANLNADHEEQRAKEHEKLEVDAAYEDYMGKCEVRIKWILFQDICAIVVVRNAVLVDSTVCPTAEIMDCDVEDWVPGSCSLSCDDQCPDPNDPFQCGGWQNLMRRIIVQPNSCGLACPSLTYMKKCNQIKCPVDCVMSEWSDYSKCTKDCESGVQSRTRSVLTEAKNGGEWCEVPTESRACNTGSCDRNCELADWTEWTPCSMACTPGEDAESGFKKRVRDVVVPTRGEGKCPVVDDEMRLQNEECNVHQCAGNEECYAMQDLVLAIDGSGSVTADNFEIMKEYVSKLVNRYKGEVYNMELMKVGLVQFGNGEIMEDGTISPALKILPLTSDMDAIQEAISELQFLKGFTNMAQAFAMTETMYTEAGREAAQSAVMIITDGKPSFAFQTQQKVDELEERGIQRYFVTITDEEGAETELMKKWASDPWYTNHLHIPGFAALASTNETYVQENVVMFCPNSQSPQLCHAIGYQHARFLGWAVDFPEGAYNMNAMMNRGAPNDDMSSVKVFGENCVASLYQHWDFTGWVFDYPEGWYDFRQFLQQGARNDQVSSIFVWKDDPSAYAF